METNLQNTPKVSFTPSLMDDFFYLHQCETENAAKFMKASLESIEVTEIKLVSFGKTKSFMAGRVRLFALIIFFMPRQSIYMSLGLYIWEILFYLEIFEDGIRGVRHFFKICKLIRKDS